MIRRTAVLVGVSVAAFVAATALGLMLLLPLGFFWTSLRPVLHKDIINRYAAQYKMDPLFVMALVKVESGFSRHARSHRGAVGLMQLMPDTGLEMARRAGLKVTLEQLPEPEVNIHLGVHYLSILRAEFKDDAPVLAAYNAGPTNARAWLKGRETLDHADIPFPETRDFVRRVKSTHRWLKRFQKVKNAVL